MNSIYYNKLKERITNLLENQALTVCGILNNSEGAYPDDILICLDDLVNDHTVLFENGQYKLSQHEYAKSQIFYPDNKKQYFEEIDELVLLLSKPHPADFDWRFTSSTINKLSLLIGERTNSVDIALFGVTTLFAVLKMNGIKNNISLFNKSDSLIADLQKMGYSEGLFVHDLFYKIKSQRKYGIVIADPPWYNDFYSAFIDKASDVLSIGGYLYLSVLPVLTRPEAEQDRIFIENCCLENGFDLVEMHPGYLTYESPNFEQQSLIKRGINCKDWRKGDLHIYRKKRKKNLTTSISKNSGDPIWEEFIINEVKIKILNENDDGEVFSFEYADDDIALSTVSRRSLIRARISFWTSDNFAFKITKIKVLRLLFRFVKSGMTIEEALKLVKIEESLDENEFKILVNLIKIAHIYK